MKKFSLWKALLGGKTRMDTASDEIGATMEGDKFWIWFDNDETNLKLDRPDKDAFELNYKEALWLRDQLNRIL